MHSGVLITEPQHPIALPHIYGQRVTFTSMLSHIIREYEQTGLIREKNTTQNQCYVFF